MLSKELQKERRAKVVDRLVELTLPYYDEKGIWQGLKYEEEEPVGLRLTLWTILIYLISTNREANEMALKIIKAREWNDRGLAGLFNSIGSLQVLCGYKEKLDLDSLSIMEQHARDGIEIALRGYHFSGANDNHPAIATSMCILGHAYFGDKTLIEEGMIRLREFESLMIRRGLCSEYSSPNYSGGTTLAMAEIVNYSTDKEARELALKLEERMWVDVLSHYHNATSEMAGPFARSYEANDVANPDLHTGLYYMVFGDDMTIPPFVELLASENGDGKILYAESIRAQQIPATWQTSADYHCPQKLIDWVVNRSYPFEFKATTESRSYFDSGIRDPDSKYLKEIEYPSQSGLVQVYMQPLYSLGTASNDFLDGLHTNHFNILYCRDKDVKGHGDVGNVICRMVVNDKDPHRGVYLFPDEGRKWALQHQNTALVVYAPKLPGHTDVTSLKLSLAFATNYTVPEEIWLGDQRVTDFTETSVETCPLFVKDGPVYMAFHPLNNTDLGRAYSIRVEKYDPFVLVSFYNLCGRSEAETIDPQEFMTVKNGFVSVASSEEESGSFNAFKAKYTDCEITDQGDKNRHIKYQNDDLVLECEVAPISNSLRFMAVNGRVPVIDRMEADSLDVKELPLM